MTIVSMTFLALYKGKNVLGSIEGELSHISYLLDYKLLRVKKFEIVSIVHGEDEKIILKNMHN